MKSVKAKLFSLYAITITTVLVFLTLISLYFFQLNKDQTTLELLDITSQELEEILEKNHTDIKNIDKYIDLKNQFLIIFKNQELAFSNQSNYKTQKILKEIHYDEDYEDKDDEHHYEKYKKEDEYLERKYKEYLEEEFIEIDDFIFTFDFIEYKNNEYEIYLGINERFLDESVNSIYQTIIILNIVILLILLIIGYILINKTIKPLKQILQDVNLLQNNSDLSKRLQGHQTGDEFEELTQSFNTLLTNIEKSVQTIKQFSSDASHELKTPLTVIQGELELCQNNKALSKEELLQSIAKVDREQKKLQTIINSFLILSRLDKEVAQRQKANLDEVILLSVEDNLEAIENKNLELQLDLAEDLIVNFNDNYLQIVINNLLSNAVKYTNKGYISISTKKENNQIILSIKDSGIGISKEDLDKVFDRFFRVDKVRTSTKDGIGLGLSIVKKICEKFDTEISVKSELNKGSEFILTFKR